MFRLKGEYNEQRHQFTISVYEDDVLVYKAQSGLMKKAVDRYERFLLDELEYGINSLYVSKMHQTVSMAEAGEIKRIYEGVYDCVLKYYADNTGYMPSGR